MLPKPARVCSLIPIVSSLLVAFAITACDNTGNPANQNQPNKPTHGGPESQAGGGQIGEIGGNGGGANGNDEVPIVGHAWCENVRQQQDSFQIRLHFIDGENYDLNIYSLGSRGRIQPPTRSEAGTYTLSDDQITTTPNGGSAETFTVSVTQQDPVTGAARLHLVDGAGAQTDFDPCY